MIYPNGHVDYLMYLGDEQLIGVAQITMPPIKYKTVNVTGAGVMGDVTIPLAGMIDAMSVTINFSSVTEAVVALGTNEWHNVAVRAADQYFDSVNRTEEVQPVWFEMSIRPTETNLGTIQTASAADASGTYSVSRYTVYKGFDYDIIIDIDPFNHTHVINGVDNAALIKKAIGLM